MGREVWGTYSVKDHMTDGAFLGDLLFYDRLVLPVPEEGAEAEWAKKGWAPDKQTKLRRELEAFDRVKAVPWQIGTWERERAAFAEAVTAQPGLDAEVAREVARDAFLFTRTRLVESLPHRVRGVTSVPTYTSAAALSKSIGLKAGQAGELRMAPESMAAAAMRFKFLVPKFKGETKPRELKLVLERSGEKNVKKARDAFWRWQRDFFGDDVITDQSTLDEAVEEMADLVADLQRAMLWGKVKTAGQYLFLAGSVSLAMFGGPLTPVGVAGTALSVGRFAFDKVVDRQAGNAAAPTAALFTSVKAGLPFSLPDD